MKNQIINEIQRKMLPYLNNEQLLHLKAVLEASFQGVIIEMGEVHASDIGFDVAILRTHTHKTAAEELLIIADGVDRTHHRVYLSVIGEHRHLHWCTECPAYFLLRSSRLFHGSVAVALAHRAIKNAFNLLGGQFS